MNPYNFATLLFAFGSFFVGLLVWFKRQDTIGRVYFFLSMATAIWGVGFAVMMNNQSYELALFSASAADAGALFIPPTWLHLCLLLSKNLKKHKKLLFILYIISFCLFCIAFTPLFVAKVKPILSFRYWLHPGPVFHLFTFMFFTVVPFGFVQLFSSIKELQGEEKTQLKGLTVATLIGFIGGGLSFAPNYDIPIPQYAIFFMPAYPFVTAYFMMKHRLFDVEQAIQSFQREKLATIGLIAASINHEIRNPLYAVKSLLEVYIENEKEGLKNRTPLETSERALKQVGRALDVITKLNRFAKPSVEPEATGLMPQASAQEAIQNVLDLISYEFELDRIHIQNNLPKDLPIIQADQRQLEEILFNLIVNACHAMSHPHPSSPFLGGGEEGVVADRPVPFSYEEGVAKGGTLEISATCHPSHVTLHISDTGTGIPPEQAKHLFEPFHTTKGEKGTGLGLYITKQLVERNNGRISVKSEENKGTKFVLEFKVGNKQA